MRRRLAQVGLLLALAGCAQEGGIQLRFELDEDVELDGAWLHVSVREASGRVLGGDVRQYGEGAIDLSVAHGDGRIAVVEVRDGADPATAAIRGYGISAPFSLRVGTSEAVEVPIEIQAVARVLVLDAPEARGGFVRTSTVQLTIEVSRDDVGRATVAQDPGFTLGREDLEVEGRTFTVSYDLDAACRPLGACVDGPRSVFVRVTDAAGYPSEPVNLVLQRDTTPPALVPGTSSVQFDAPGRFVEVNQADEGFEVRLSFVLTEALTSTPSLALAGSVLPFTFQERANSAWVFVRTIGPEDPDGEQQPVLTAEDRAGNRAELPLEVGYRVERDLPGAPDVQTPGRIVYRRAPFGTAETRETTFEVVGVDGAVSPFAFVHIYDAAEVFDGTRVIAVRLGQDQADANGAFRVALDPFDRERVYVLAISASGSVSGSTAALVEQVEYVAPGTAERAGSAPAEAATRPSLGVGLAPPPSEAPVDDRAALQAADGRPLSLSSPPRYRHFLPRTSPAPDTRRFAGATYDWVRDRVVIVGGRSARDLVQTDVWEWDGRGWAQQTAGGFPSCEDGTGFGDDPFGYTAFVGSLSRTVVLCRYLDPVAPPPLSGPGEIDELRATGWDGAAWGPVRLLGAERPVGRVGHAVAYDRARRRLVLFGGNTGSLQIPGADAPGFRETLGDLWELEAVLPEAHAATSTPTAQAGLRWVRPPVSGPAPGPRDRAGLVYDPVQEAVVLFGGFGPDRAPLDDLWTWDGAQWRQIPRASPWPAARGGHTMVFDPRTGRVGILAGTDVEPSARQLARQDPGLGDGWWWDGAAWSPMQTGDAAGIAVVVASADAASPIQLSAVALPGDEVRPADTYALTAAGRWLRTPTADAPPVGISVDTAYDEVREELLLVGLKSGETWRWSSSGWRQRDPGPGLIGDGDLVHDPVRDRTYAWARTFALNPARMTVLEATGPWAPLEPSPRPRSADLLETLVSIFDPVRGQMVTFSEPTAGGWGLWAFDGAAWTRFDNGIADLVGGDTAQLAYAGAGRYFLDDSSSAFTYEAGAFAASTPAPRGRLAHDAGRDRLMAFAPEGELYERSATGSWSRITAANPPIPAGLNPGPQQHFYDAPGRRFWTTVGSAPGEPPGGVFALEVDPEARPAVITRIDLDAARVPPGRVTAISVAGVAGGAGYSGAVDEPGVEILGYDPGAGEWRAIDTGGGIPAAPSPMRATADGPLAPQLILTSPGRVAIAVSTAGRRGERAPDQPPPQLVVDQLFTTIHYRLPSP